MRIIPLLVVFAMALARLCVLAQAPAAPTVAQPKPAPPTATAPAASAAPALPSAPVLSPLDRTTLSTLIDQTNSLNQLWAEFRTHIAKDYPGYHLQQGPQGLFLEKDQAAALNKPATTKPTTKSTDDVKPAASPVSEKKP